MPEESPQQHLNSTLALRTPAVDPPDQQAYPFDAPQPASYSKTRDLQEPDISATILVEVPQHPGVLRS
jgi:hypothetical protein